MRLSEHVGGGSNLWEYCISWMVDFMENPQMEVSWNRGTPKSSISIYFNKIVHCKLAILGVAPFQETSSEMTG